jgi:hypothetical protein
MINVDAGYDMKEMILQHVTEGHFTVPSLYIIEKNKASKIHYSWPVGRKSNQNNESEKFVCVCVCVCVCVRERERGRLQTIQTAQGHEVSILGFNSRGN